MTPLAPSNPGRMTIEQGVNAMVSDVRNCLCRKCGECEECVRRSPGKALLLAVGAGYLLNRLPVRSLIVSQIRLAAALAPPALLAFGAAKLCEFLQSQARAKAPPVVESAGELPSLP